MLVIDQDSRPACCREDRRPGHIHALIWPVARPRTIGPPCAMF